MKWRKTGSHAASGKHMYKFEKTGVLLLSFTVLIVVVIGGTLSLLLAKDSPIKNMFSPSKIPNEITETTENNVKENVKVKNNGEVDAYVRAAIVVTWAEVDANGDPTGNIYGIIPEEGVGKDYLLILAENSGWEKGPDGYYYYTSKVSANEETAVLISKCETLTTATQPEGYILSVEIIGQSIQADGVDSDNKHPVELVWPVTVNQNGSISVKQNG